MEEIKHRLGDYKYYFFKNLQNYLDTELLFYGSIKREDYFENASDVDITIINDNVSSILSKLTNYLYIDKSNIKQIYQKFTEKSTILVSGYKLKYDNKENNTRRFRYGTLAIKNIKKQQKLNNCLILSKSPFEKLVRNIFKQNKNDSPKFSKDIFIVLQYFIEQYIVGLLRNSNFLAIHSGRVKLIPYDILLYNSFVNGGHGNPYTKSSVNLFSLENEDNLIFDVNQEEEKSIDYTPYIEDDENEIST